MRVWRVVLFASLLLQLTAFVLTWRSTPDTGDLGFEAAFNKNELIVTRVYGRGAAAVHAGDVLAPTQFDRNTVLAVAGYGPAGERVDIPVVRNGTRKQVEVTLDAGARPITPAAIELLVVGMLNLLLGALITARGRLDLRTLLTATFLMATGSFGLDVGAAAPGLAGIALALSMGLYYGARYTAGAFLIWTFAGARTRLVRAAIAVAVVVIAITTLVDYWLPVFLPFQTGTLLTILGYGSIATNICFALCWILAASISQRNDRPRLLLFAIAIVPWCLGVIAENLLQALPTYRALPLYVEFVSRFFELILPLTLAYALLVRRVIDIGFAINRAVVFAFISAVIVGAFVLVEWAGGEWLKQQSHATNLVIDAALALTLGVSMRFIHGKIDTFVDNVFFRKRHEDERALHRFAHEAAFISDPETLVERALQVVRLHAGASAARILLLEDDNYDGISENDPAIVALKAWHKPLDLHSVQTELKGEYAFPLGAQGAVTGVLVIGAKTSCESYAPDELESVAALANGTGSALYSLRRDSNDARVLAAIQAMHADMMRRLDIIGIVT